MLLARLYSKVLKRLRFRMQTQHHRPGGDRLGHEDHEVHAAIRFAVLAGIAGIAFLVVGAMWASTCQGAMAIDTVACEVV